MNVAGVISVEVDLNTGEVTVEAKPESVGAEQLVEAASNARDSVHSFKASLKRGPERVKKDRKT